MVCSNYLKTNFQLAVDHVDLPEARTADDGVGGAMHDDEGHDGGRPARPPARWRYSAPWCPGRAPPSGSCSIAGRQRPPAAVLTHGALAAGAARPGGLSGSAAKHPCRCSLSALRGNTRSLRTWCAAPAAAGRSARASG